VRLRHVLRHLLEPAPLGQLLHNPAHLQARKGGVAVRCAAD
jgi:hypothetical protein